MTYPLNDPWRPGALDQRPVPYPDLPFVPDEGPVRRGGRGVAAGHTAFHQRIPTTRPGVNSAMSWGRGTSGTAPSWSRTGSGGNTATVTVPGVGGRARGGGGGFGGGVGGLSGGPGDLAQYYQQELDRANQANEARYRDVLGGYQSRYERALATLYGSGEQEARDIDEQSRKRESQLQQGLIGRGLGNSTVMSTMALGVDRERNAEMGRLQQRLREQRLTTDAGLSGDLLNFMERKTEKGPDVGLLAQLAQGMGQAGYGGGYVGGGVGGAPLILEPIMANGASGYGPPQAMAYNPMMYRDRSQFLQNRANLRGRLAAPQPQAQQLQPVSPGYGASWRPSGAPGNLLDFMGSSPIANRIRNETAIQGHYPVYDPYYGFGG